MGLRSLRALAVVAAALIGAAAAQPQLIVNGVTVAGATTTLVSGHTYAPAAALARALGARFEVDLATQRLTFTLGARVVQVRSVSDAAAAATLPDALWRDGVAQSGTPAVVTGLEPFVPVKGVAEALGARVSFVSPGNQVLVVAPRADVSASLEGRAGEERLVLRLSAPVRVTAFLNEPVQTLELRLERSNLAQSAVFSADAFVRADVVQDRSEVTVRVQLAPDTSAHWVEVPDGEGFAVVISFRRLGAAVARPPAASAGSRVVLDAGAGSGADAATLTLEAVLTMARELERGGVEVELTRTGAVLPSPEERAAIGTGARLFLSLQVADLSPGTARLYHLGDAADLASLQDAVRVNAETLAQRGETDAVRRALLIDLAPDLALGARYSAALAAGLRSEGFSVASPRAAPVAVLTGAAGRGVLLEVAAQDLRDPGFALRLAALLAELADGAAQRP